MPEYVDPDGTVHVLPDDPAELTAAIQAIHARRQRLQGRRQFIDDVEQAWALAKDQGQDHLDQIPPPPSGNASLALHTEQIAYLYGRVQQITRWIAGGGTVGTPGIGDVVVMMARILVRLIDDTDIEPPEP